MNRDMKSLSVILGEQFNKNITESSDINILMNLCANEWIKIAKTQSNPRPLFGNFWHQGEVAILFSNTGKGKSILAVQLANGISKGMDMLAQETTAQKVIYFDFELSTKAFERRYTNENGFSYKFSEDFLRVEIDRDKELESAEKTFEELLIESIKEQVGRSAAQVVIIDNITFLSAANEKSKEALALMKLIIDLSRKRNLAILLIAHTPKRDIYKPIQLEDLAGSKALSNFTDVCFCIGESAKGADIRYIKQLKNRNFPIEFHDENVMECTVVKEDAFLQFKFVQFGREDEHLRKRENTSDDQIEEILEMKKQNLSNVQIAAALGVSETAIRRRLKKNVGRLDAEL